MKKYKLKTHKSSVKRFKITGTGKVVRRELQNRNNSHMVNMRKRARKLVPGSFVITSRSNIKKIKKLLGK